MSDVRLVEAGISPPLRDLTRCTSDGRIRRPVERRAVQLRSDDRRGYRIELVAEQFGRASGRRIPSSRIRWSDPTDRRIVQRQRTHSPSHIAPCTAMWVANELLEMKKVLASVLHPRMPIADPTASDIVLARVLIALGQVVCEVSRVNADPSAVGGLPTGLVHHRSDDEIREMLRQPPPE